MVGHNKHLLDFAYTDLRILSSFGFKGIVAGGFARDVYYNREAKDIDINVGLADSGYEKCALDKVIQYFKGYYKAQVWRNDKTDPAWEGCGSVPTEDDHAVDTVLHLPGHLCDIIFYREVPEAKAIVNRFDCNLNQFVMAGHMPVCLADGGIGCIQEGLVWLQNGIKSNRVEKMSRLWTDIHEPWNKDIPFN